MAPSEVSGDGGGHGGRLGVVLGSSALGPGGEQLSALVGDLGIAAIQRHVGDPYLTPDRIDHRANMAQLTEAGCDRVLAISSVGSLRTDLGVGSVLCPNDYIALNDAPSIFYDARGHGTRDLDGPWRAAILAAWSRAPGAGPLEPQGVYWQSRGPRFETPAEVRLIAQHADVVGMTVASECVAAQEAGLLYAAICVVDNLANGLGEQALTLEEFDRGRAASAGALRTALAAVLPELAR